MSFLMQFLKSCNRDGSQVYILTNPEICTLTQINKQKQIKVSNSNIFHIRRGSKSNSNILILENVYCTNLQTNNKNQNHY